MHPKVAGAIQGIDAALFNGDTFDDPEKVEIPAREPSEGWKALGEIGADFIRSHMCRPSVSAPVCVREDGSWKDDAGVVHVVNATWIEPDVDLGRETACGSASWDPDNPRTYPAVTDKPVDCMTCVVKQARLCL